MALKNRVVGNQKSRNTQVENMISSINNFILQKCLELLVGNEVQTGLFSQNSGSIVQMLVIFFTVVTLSVNL